MVGLLDLAPSTRTVKVGGADVAVYGVSAKGIAALLQSFPALQSVFVGGSAEMTGESLFATVPDAISAIIAAGCGTPGDPKAIEIAERLPAADQAELLDAILDLTMPKGVGPFVDALNALLGKLDGVASVAHGKAPA